MKRYTLLLALIIIFGCTIPGKADTITINNENDLHRFVQYENTSETLKTYFSEKKIVSESSFLITVILPPMACPRCEGLITPFLNDLKKIDSNLSTAIFTFYSKSKPAYKYLLERRYPADDFYLFTSNDFLENFYLTSNGLQVPFFVKFNIKTGELIISKSTLGMNYDTNIAEAFVKLENPIKKHRKENSSKELNTRLKQMESAFDSLTASKENSLSNYKIFTIKEDKEFVLSEINRISYSADGKKISFMDDLTNSVCIYSRSNGQYQLIRNIKADEYEERLFFDKELGNEMFLFMKKINVLNSMYFNSAIFGDSVIISASLPEVFFEDKEAEEIAYMNKIVFLIKNIYDNKGNSYFTPDTNFLSLSIDHTYSRFFPPQNKILIPVSKGWPVSGISSLPDDPEENPFLTDFYNFTPSIAVFDMKGKFQRLAGSLDPIHKHYKLGYAFYKPIIKFCNNEFWIADSYAGKIMKLNINLVESNHEITLFDIAEYQTDWINAKEGTLEYIKTFNKFLTSSIIDFEIVNEKIISIIRSGDHYFLCSQDLSGNKPKYQKAIPNKVSEYECRSLQLLEVNQKVVIMGVYESDLESVIVQFDIMK